MIGIQSAGTLVGAAKTLNFVGTGNSISTNGETINIEISGGGGGGGSAGSAGSGNTPPTDPPQGNDAGTSNSSKGAGGGGATSAGAGVNTGCFSNVAGAGGAGAPKLKIKNQPLRRLASNFLIGGVIIKKPHGLKNQINYVGLSGQVSVISSGPSNAYSGRASLGLCDLR